MPTAIMTCLGRVVVDRVEPLPPLMRAPLLAPALELSESSRSPTHPVGARVGTILWTPKELVKAKKVERMTALHLSSTVAKQQIPQEELMVCAKI
jgi:hypothetical protein